MSAHTHGGYGHDHDGGDLPHTHDEPVAPVEVTVEAAPPPEPADDVDADVAIAAIDAVTEVATAALDAMAAVEIAEERTETVEAVTDAVEAVAQADETEAITNPDPPREGESSEEERMEDDQPGDDTADEAGDDDLDEPGEDEPAGQTVGEEPTGIAVPPQLRDDRPRSAPSGRQRVSAFRAHRGGRR